MSIKQKANRAPKLFLEEGRDALVLRKKIGLSQSDFWSRIAVTQSGGSRNESGRNLTTQVQLLLHLAYAPEAEALAMLSHLRCCANPPK